MTLIGQSASATNRLCACASLSVIGSYKRRVDRAIQSLDRTSTFAINRFHQRILGLVVIFCASATRPMTLGVVSDYLPAGLEARNSEWTLMCYQTQSTRVTREGRREVASGAESRYRIRLPCSPRLALKPALFHLRGALLQRKLWLMVFECQ